MKFFNQRISAMGKIAWQKTIFELLFSSHGPQEWMEQTKFQGSLYLSDALRPKSCCCFQYSSIFNWLLFPIHRNIGILSNRKSYSSWRNNLTLAGSIVEESNTAGLMKKASDRRRSVVVVVIQRCLNIPFDRIRFPHINTFWKVQEDNGPANPQTIANQLQAT